MPVRVRPISPEPTAPRLSEKWDTLGSVVESAPAQATRGGRQLQGHAYYPLATFRARKATSSAPPAIRVAERSLTPARISSGARNASSRAPRFSPSRAPESTLQWRGRTTSGTALGTTSNGALGGESAEHSGTRPGQCEALQMRGSVHVEESALRCGSPVSCEQAGRAIGTGLQIGKTFFLGLSMASDYHESLCAGYFLDGYHYVGPHLKPFPEFTCFTTDGIPGTFSQYQEITLPIGSERATLRPRELYLREAWDKLNQTVLTTPKLCIQQRRRRYGNMQTVDIFDNVRSIIFRAEESKTYEKLLAINAMGSGHNVTKKFGGRKVTS
ncbi:hypothetical protein B0H10DRAFT_1956498 [Mycena sp. CBHHK59/15]|nr:hypothetical protein B0H10DRAFT_1956498 [Mycena sp. CBHHK59/15]